MSNRDLETVASVAPSSLRGKRARPRAAAGGAGARREWSPAPQVLLLALGWLGLFASPASPFTLTYLLQHHSQPSLVQTGPVSSRICVPWRGPLSLSSTSSSEPNVQEPTTTTDATPIETMTVKEIKAELKERSVSFQDCFDRDSLAQRLVEARSGVHEGSTKAPPSPHPQSKADEGESSQPTSSRPVESTTAPTSSEDLDAIKKMSVKELRSELASWNVGWKTFVDKDDLVRAVMRARHEASRFSSTGLLRPGIVGDLSAEQVRDEINNSKTPMLLDVYATWCGPCQMMSPILVQASQEVTDVRFAKMDSDRYPDLAGSLRVQGLPTLVLFNKGTEVARLEGALMKDQLVAWIRDKLDSSM